MIVLETHTLLRWASGDVAQLSAVARQAIEAELHGGWIRVSSISAWERAMLVVKGPVALSMDLSAGGCWCSARSKRLALCRLDNEIAVMSTDYPVNSMKIR